MGTKRLNVICFSLLAMGSAAGAQAVTIDFEPPTYAVGDLAGQDGWVQLEGNPTFATILGPEGGSISGFSSASIVGGAGGTGGLVLTAYKNAVDSVEADGTDASDLNATFLYRKTQALGFGGLYLGNDGLGDASAYVRVSGANIEAIQAGGDFVNLGTYTLFDIVEFSIDVDLDSQVYSVAIRNVTLGEDTFSSLTPVPLSLNGVMISGDVAVSVSGQLAQTIYDEITLTPAASGAIPGLVAAYGFEEAIGDHTVRDASGNENDGLISGARRTTEGRFGKALEFDGKDDWVTIADADSLDLTTGMTLEAWVYPTRRLRGWSTVLLKERPDGLAYALYANSDARQPVASVHIESDQNLYGGQRLLPNQWTHLAATYDGSALRLYANGEEVAYQGLQGAIEVSDGVLRIGGNNSWLDEFFKGLIDEVRIYDRALSVEEIQADMVTPVTPGAPADNGLVGAYGFEEGAGAQVLDASGNDNGGLISGATRTAEGRFGSALSFDGIDDWVTVADADSLDLTTGMTLEAWVYPTEVLTGWRTVLLKEQPDGLAYALYANSDANQPVSSVQIGVYHNLYGGDRLPPNVWAHLATTYDGTTQRLFVNGEEVAHLHVSGSLTVSDGELRIGGNSSWLDEFFRGRIDEVRVYNRALSVGEIQADMEHPVVTQP